MIESHTREFQQIKQQLLSSLSNHGRPVIYVQDANYKNRGELYLEHEYLGIELKLDYAQDTLANLHSIWKRPVNIETVVDDRPTILNYDGKKHSTNSKEKQ